MSKETLVAPSMILGRQVKHRLYGVGSIIDFQDGRIVVEFSGEQKTFQFPAAFKSFLKTEDNDFLTIINSAFEQEEAARKKAEEDRIAMESQRISTPATPVGPRVMVDPLYPEGSSEFSQEHVCRPAHGLQESVAFKCTFCDGGSSSTCIGFRGKCSDYMIRCNIEVFQRVWCSTGSICKEYYDAKQRGNRNFSRKDLDLYCEPDGSCCACYESKLLNTWTMRAGIHQSGPDTGKPMHLNRIHPGSLAVMTTRKPRDTEADRFIFAAWIVNDVFSGDEQDEGFVTSDPAWRIELLPGEAERILFWNYYCNANKPDRIVFGSGLHRYLTDIEAAQILHDIARVKKDDFSKRFFMHFCKINGIDPDGLPRPSGALLRKRK